jgi:hypothetical protein
VGGCGNDFSWEADLGSLVTRLVGNSIEFLLEIELS